jgi:hypothetical protein
MGYYIKTYRQEKYGTNFDLFSAMLCTVITPDAKQLIAAQLQLAV